MNIQSPEHRIAAKFRQMNRRLTNAERGGRRGGGARVDRARRFYETYDGADVEMTAEIDDDPTFRWDDPSSGGWDLSVAEAYGDGSA